MSQADILVGYNSRRFDTPHVRTELLLDGYTPPPPVKQIDLMQVVKRQFRLEYNNLGSVTTALGVETKLETGGFDLWKACIAGDPEAWALMRKYNIQDRPLLLEPDAHMAEAFDLPPSLSGHERPSSASRRRGAFSRYGRVTASRRRG